jgi:hypothetical protein
MGSINSAIDNDMDDYLYLCKKFNEKPQYSLDAYGNNLLDCYGKHATDLKKRNEIQSKHSNT